ncbi:hypothetical protein ACHAXT_000797 [Thalassiosira profunda]
MKDLLLATLLAAAAVARGVAAETGLNLLDDIASSLKRPELSIDWKSALACTADMNNPQNPQMIDQQTCAKTSGADQKPCVWCDATATLGQGLCVGESQKEMLGPYWDQLCSSSGTTPDPPAPVTPPPVPPPTPPPVAPAPKPDDNIPDSLKCAMDANQEVVADQTTCEARADPTSAAGEKCVWCDVPILGGSCITNDMKASVGMFCSNVKEGHLRGENNGGGWKNLDPSCLGNGAGGNAKEGCGARADSAGNQCLWCDAGGVFGICAAPSQRDYLGTYMNCEEKDGAEPPMAVE